MGCMGEYGVTNDYKEKLQEALEYQDFIADQLLKHLGIAVTLYSSEKRQLTGETRQGIEIKHDKVMHSTGNIYIEISEKSNPMNQYYVPSGIYRNDNTWLYLVGDHLEAFIFGKGVLQSIYETKHCWHQYGLEERETPTSQGFTLKIEKIKERKGVILKHLTFKEEQ